MVRITLPDNSTRSFDSPLTAFEVAQAISPRLAQDALAVRVDGQLVDTKTLIDKDHHVEIVTTKSDPTTAVDLMRHSCAHVMAEAICRLFPETKLVYGPSVENGFYYDIDLDRPITPEDFPAIEAEMAKIVASDKPFCRYEMTREEAMPRLKAEGNRYKLDNAERAQSDVLSFYTTGQPGDGSFEDLCRGPHVPSTAKVGAYKVMSVAGAYYRGDASEKMLQRVYGTSWPTKKELDAYLFQLEEAKKRDHRVLGKQLDLFSVHDHIGPGLIHWHPNGALIRHEVETFWKNEHLKRGYDLLYTPHIASERVFQLSGHLEKYADMMYSPMDLDGQNYYLKPMNCPFHYAIYKTAVRSYKDLALRWCELGTVYRYEPSGTLHGMLRVRGFTQDDAHTFCTPEQLGAELDLILELMHYMMTTFGYTYKAYLATRPEKYLGTEEEWERATQELRAALERRGLEYEVDEGGGVFYAPKIDIKLIDSLGREWQGPTHQVDLQAAKRFKISYVGADNHEHEPIIIHRTVLGSMERFIGGLIEHFGGAFPLWLSPEQARVLPISEKTNEYAASVLQKLRNAGLRCSMDISDDKINAKIKRAHEMKLPYMLVVGPAEAQNDSVTVRIRGCKEQRNIKVDEFIASAQQDINTRCLEPGLKS
ncbi:MAG: threonine--tRNA ligase [Sedimentisphaerales bacterium]|nr:threonine--tRNA ligase [Sedimentisphaerales bacterium]